MELFDKKFAVLIDADNISHRKVKDILDEIAKYGTPTIKRIYGDFTDPKFAAWKNVLLENSISPVQQYAYTTGKNATDSALIIDAMDTLHKEAVDGFCIVSSDSDYTRLASRLRESGKLVLGFGEKKTPLPFIKSCDKFIYVEILGQTTPRPKAAPTKKASGKQSGNGQEATATATAETKQVPEPAPAQPVVDEDFKQLLEDTIDDAADDSGWAFLGVVGNVITKKMPDFDPRNFGFKKLSLLIKSLSDIIDIEERHSETPELKQVYVRNRTK
ncbi:NYN domain-containing protein [uncultured Alistipes sp.]|uniref:NYN domain-containing protein n=1 Tax=uncultured Alistipes sp. TaxID=538949 RepID=UPI0025E053BF|nr:NYN domain-containing protein [uncultured Alistipes sp.]